MSLAPSRVTSFARALAFAAPVALGVASAPFGSTWRDDGVLIASTELALRPGHGALTTLIASAAALLPLGDLAFRAALASAVLAGFLGVIVLGLARRALAELSPRENTRTAIACIASLSVTLSPLVAREASVAGSGVLGGVVAAALLRLAFLPGTSRGHVALGAGVLLSLLALERVSAALVVGAAMLAFSLVARRASSMGAVLVLLGAVLPLALFLPLLVLRGGELAALTELSIRQDLDAMFVIDVAALRTRGVGAFLHDLGPFAVGLAVLGFAACLVRGHRLGFRVLAGAVPLAVMLASDLLVPPSRAALFQTDPFVVVRIAAVISAGVLAGVGILAVIERIHATRLPGARATAALVVTFQAAIAAMAAEESYSGAPSERRGAQRWTEEAWLALPPRAVVVVRTEPVLRRLVAASRVGGARPDVTLAALPRLGDRRVAIDLLREEPKMLALLRDVGADGVPGEAALSTLADDRPLFVELDPKWEPRLATHTMPDHLLLRFAPQPLGPSDRKLADVDTRVQAAKVLGADGKERDAATREVLAEHARQGLIATTLAHDRESSNRAYQLLVDLGVEISPSDPAYPYLDVARHAASQKRTDRRKR